MTRDKSDNSRDVLDTYLEGKSDLSMKYRQASSEVPPDALDKAIITASRKAVRARKPLAFSPFASDWHIPAALAAVLVLCVTLVVTIQEQSTVPVGEEMIRPRVSTIEAEILRETKEVSSAPQIAVKPETTTDETGYAAMESRKILPDTDVAVAGRMEAPTTILDHASPPQRIILPSESTVSKDSKLDIAGDAEGTESISVDDTAGTVSADFAREPPRHPGSNKLSMQRREPTVLMRDPAQLQPAVNESQSRAAVKEIAETEESSIREGQGPVQNFIEGLIGSWSGTAVTTPIGPVAYNITFTRSPDGCVTGTAQPGTNHTWTFCPRDINLILDFLTDFGGNRTPIHFRQLSYNDGVYTFKADSHDFMEVLVFGEKNATWMKIFHHGKLHVEIRLTRN